LKFAHTQSYGFHGFAGIGKNACKSFSVIGFLFYELVYHPMSKESTQAGLDRDSQESDISINMFFLHIMVKRKFLQQTGFAGGKV
jgi:hypothetical protein